MGVSVVFSFIRSYTKSAPTIMKYLNVAEKNDAAKNIAALLSRNTARRREGLSRFNKIYEFDATVQNRNVTMVMTSVSGHLMNYEFTANFRNWKSCNPIALFDAPIVKACSKDYEPIKKTLEREVGSCSGLIIWTDCDREGENIGFEIIKVCKDIKPDITVFRAKFSEITAASVFRALNNLEQPNKNISDAVDVRQEIDLRSGAAFTRFQTLHLSQVFPQKLSDKLISYGSCQFPTLGFVVERFQIIENFISEPFWRIKMEHTIKDITVDFNWDRGRLFSERSCQSILDICQEVPNATVESVISKPKTKWRPLPLDTVEMEKNISRKLRINARETMSIAERLYTQGFISYPRTETNIFPKELNLQPLIEQQTVDQRWGEFATGILNTGGPAPRQGKKTDQAHPPIHPIKHAPNLQGNEQRVYEYIVRHFLACCSKDALGQETIVRVNIAGEKFTAKGLIILERNYLEVYIYEKWNAKEIHDYKLGDTFMPTVLEMVQGNTSPPKLLTEADLIALMEKNGIGTDATHADHIDTIKSREYVGLHENIYFVPGILGMGLVEGYDNIGLEVSLAKPALRSEFESDLKLISEGLKDPNEVLRIQKAKYRAVFENVVNRIQQLEEKLAFRIEEERNVVQNNEVLSEETFKPVLKCPKCEQAMILKKRKDGNGLYISCCGFPACKNVVWLPGFVEKADVLDENCPNCPPDTKKLKIKFRLGQNPFFGENPLTLCIGGCDTNVLENLNINISDVRQNNNLNSTNLNNTTMRITDNTTNINVSQRSTFNNVQNNTFMQNSQRNQLNSRQNTTSTVRPASSQHNAENNQWNQQGGSSWSRQNSSNPGSSWSRQNSSNPGGNRNSATLCNCGEEATLLTVRKEGPNKGREFYKCAKSNNGCNFFLWSNNQSTEEIPPETTSTISTLTCNCGQEVAKRIVRKEGPNKGRAFFCCPGPMEAKCNFFKWAEDNEDGGNTSFSAGQGRGNSFSGKWRGRGAGRGAGRGTKRSAPQNKNVNGKVKRKCGKCGEEGHNRTNCPN